MLSLKNVPHPLSLLRDHLIKWRAPSNRVIRDAALVKGLETIEADTSYATFIDANGREHPCYRVDTGAVAKSIYSELLAALDTSAIPYFTGGGADPWVKALHVSSRDARLFVRSIVRNFASDQRILVRVNNAAPQTVASLNIESGRYSRITLLCIEKSAGKAPALACSWIDVNVWREVPGYSAQRLYETATMNPHVRRLRYDTIERFLTNHEDLSALDSSLTAEATFPIDVVYTWVDDKDDAWQAAKRHHSGRAAEASDLSRSNHDERFTNRDELKYSMRSLEMFAPFVRNIYLVTSGHFPKWLRTDHPKVKIVPHREIYAQQSHLPTFNSSSIETQLHHIEGLSEHFLYFNDDFFLGDFCKPSDFFFANGTMKYFAAEQRAYEHDIDQKSEEYIAADRNAIELLKSHFGAFTRELMIHAPYPARRSILSEMENLFKEQFDACASQRFRSHSDLRPIAFMQYHFGFQKSQAVPATISNKYLALWKPSIDRILADLLRNRRYKTFCINDVGIPPSRLNWTNKQVRSFLESYFPFKSTFEK